MNQNTHFVLRHHPPHDLPPTFAELTAVGHTLEKPSVEWTIISRTADTAARIARPPHQSMNPPMKGVTTPEMMNGILLRGNTWVKATQRMSI